jgi:hypothetical protein
MNNLVQSVGEENIPIGIKGTDLNSWGLSDVSKEIISRTIQDTVTIRNGTLPENRTIEFKQLFHYIYQDTRKMLTFGGILIEKHQEDLYKTCGFHKLSHIRLGGNDAYKIEVPKLTFKEIRDLKSQLPKNPAKVKGKGIPDEDIEKFKSVYRYFPSFTESEIS